MRNGAADMPPRFSDIAELSCAHAIAVRVIRSIVSDSAKSDDNVLCRIYYRHSSENTCTIIPVKTTPIRMSRLPQRSSITVA